MAFHDLTPDQSAPKNAKSLLGLGSKFISTPSKTTGDITPSLTRMERDFNLRVYFGTGDSTETNDSAAVDKGRSKLYVNSKWSPPPNELPNWAYQRLNRFFSRVQCLFKQRKAQSNLRPEQTTLLESLPSDPTFLFPEADKGLGPCCVKYDQYVMDSLKHLSNSEVYRQLTEEEALALAENLKSEIEEWCDKYKHVIGSNAYTYITSHLSANESSPFGQFYIMYKIHKELEDDGRWPTRPVCSDVTSLPHGLGKWVTEKLHPIQQAQDSYFKDSFELKKLLDETELPPNALLFTSDAKSMYTNIKTTPALETIGAFLRNERHSLDTLEVSALTEALHLVFHNNMFKLGDTFWLQTSGTAMGTPPAPPWATIFYALHERNMVPRWQKHVLLYKRFIDDVIGVWLVDPDPQRNEQLWTEFCADMNNWYGLEWKCTTPSNTVNFMDLTISIVDGRFETTLYEKEMNLYLYIPPHSSHPRGVFTGLVFGQVLRIRRLCSKTDDADMKIGQFFTRLLARNHTGETLEPLFRRAEENAANYLHRSPEQHEAIRQQKAAESSSQVFFHLQYHPEDPPSRDIQCLWRDYVSHPQGELPLSEMENLDGAKVGFNKLVVAYSRPLNLRNRFSVRDIHGRGQPVSSFLVK